MAPVEEYLERTTKNETRDRQGSRRGRIMRRENHVATTPDRVGRLELARLVVPQVDQDTTKRRIKDKARQYRMPRTIRLLKMPPHRHQEEQPMLLMVMVLQG